MPPARICYNVLYQPAYPHSGRINSVAGGGSVTFSAALGRDCGVCVRMAVIVALKRGKGISASACNGCFGLIFVAAIAFWLIVHLNRMLAIATNTLARRTQKCSPCCANPMSRRFQFSLGRLAGSVSLLCVAGALWQQSFSIGLNPFAITGFAMALAASVGILFGRALVFAFAAYLGMLCLAVALLTWVLTWFW
jgi:hypothetical protein